MNSLYTWLMCFILLALLIMAIIVVRSNLVEGARMLVNDPRELWHRFVLEGRDFGDGVNTYWPAVRKEMGRVVYFAVGVWIPYGLVVWGIKNFGFLRFFESSATEIEKIIEAETSIFHLSFGLFWPILMLILIETIVSRIPRIANIHFVKWLRNTVLHEAAGLIYAFLTFVCIGSGFLWLFKRNSDMLGISFQALCCAIMVAFVVGRFFVQPVQPQKAPKII